MGRLHIDHRVKSVVCKRQMLRVTLLEAQALPLVMFPAETNRHRIQVERGVTARFKSARHVSRAATMAATHLQNLFPAQRHLRRDMMIKLNTRAIPLQLRREWNAHRRLFFESIIQEKNSFTTKPPGQERIPKPPDGFANPTNREKIINNRHPEIFTAKIVNRNFVSTGELLEMTGYFMLQFPPGCGLVNAAL